MNKKNRRAPQNIVRSLGVNVRTWLLTGSHWEALSRAVIMILCLLCFMGHEELRDRKEVKAEAGIPLRGLLQ